MVKQTNKDSELILQLSNVLKAKGETLSLESADFAKLSNENLDLNANDPTKVSQTVNAAINTIKSAVNMAASKTGGNISTESELGTHQYYGRERAQNQGLMAGAILMAAANNSQSYAQSRFQPRSGDNVILADQMTRNRGANAGVLQNVSMESFDESGIRSTLHANIVAVMNMTQQDDFAELFFPIYVTPATDLGYTVEVPVESAWKGFTHKPNGKTPDYDRVPVIKGLRDDEVLVDRSTQLIPIYRADGDATLKNADKFVDAAKVAPTIVKIENEEVKTAPLKVGVTVDLIGISTSEALVQRGLLDHLDSIDGTIGLDKIYLNTAAGVVQFKVKDAFGSKFRATAEGHYRQEALTFTSRSLFLTGDTLLATGAAPAAAAALKAGEFRVQLEVKLFGSVNLEEGTATVTCGGVDIVGAWKGNQAIAVTSPDLVAALGDLGKELDVIGWDPDARRTNMNIVSLGKRIERSIYIFQYKPEFHSPISIEKSLVLNNNNPTVDSLVRAAKITMSNAAVNRLMDAFQLLQNMKNVDVQVDDVRSGFFGPACVSVRPYVQHVVLDAKKIVNNVQSAQKNEDIQGALASVLTYYVGDALQRTSYGDILRLKQYGERPLVAIGTSEKIAPYLMREGDYRLLGNNVDTAIVTTTNKHMDNEIFATFIINPKDRTNVPNELDFGYCFYCPEYFVNTPTSQGNSTTQLIQIYPVFRHSVNLPILIRVTLQNLDQVIQTDISKYFADAPANNNEAGPAGPVEGFGLRNIEPAPVEAPAAPVEAEVNGNGNPGGKGRK